MELFVFKLRFFGSTHNGHAAMIAEKDAFEVASKAEKAVEVRVSMQDLAVLFSERKSQFFEANLGDHDGP